MSDPVPIDNEPPKPNPSVKDPLESTKGHSKPHRERKRIFDPVKQAPAPKTEPTKLIVPPPKPKGPKELSDADLDKLWVVERARRKKVPGFYPPQEGPDGWKP